MAQSITALSPKLARSTFLGSPAGSLAKTAAFRVVKLSGGCGTNQKKAQAPIVAMSAGNGAVSGKYCSMQHSSAGRPSFSLQTAAAVVTMSSQ